MASVEKISIALTPEFTALIREAVASGEYASTSEVIRDALRGWKARRARNDLESEAIHRLWQDGIESGPGRFSDIDDVKREARRRLESGASGQPSKSGP